MMAKAILAGVALALILSSTPLPQSEEGWVSLPPGSDWDLILDLDAGAHVTCIVHSNGPVEIRVVRTDVMEGSDVARGAADAATLYRFSSTLEEGAYRMIISNQGNGEVGIEYQVHRDYLVVANMTAKNVMALSLALAMTIVAVVLLLRPRRT